jgi:hypothetical protein
MNRYRLISALILSAVVALPAAAAAGRAVITTEQVAAAMANAGMDVSPKQVTLLTDVVAATSDPALKIQSMEPWGDHRMMVRLNCAHSEQCLPFFVAVRFKQGNELRPVAADVTQPSPAIFQQKRSLPVIRAGSPATLLLEGNHVHIRVAVVCLENGAAGQSIRVTSKDHKQIYTAEVVDGTLLRGDL